GLHVYAHPAEGLADPRLPALGRRFYTPEEPAETAEDASVYHDLRIALGIPDGGRTAQQQKDFPADLNLDRLNAIAWDKGCFIGQEVAARMHHRGLAKKRLMILGGSGLAPGDPLTLDGRVMREVRDVNTRQ